MGLEGGQRGWRRSGGGGLQLVKAAVSLATDSAASCAYAPGGPTRRAHGRVANQLPPGADPRIGVLALRRCYGHASTAMITRSRCCGTSHRRGHRRETHAPPPCAWAERPRPAASAAPKTSALPGFQRGRRAPPKPPPRSRRQADTGWPTLAGSRPRPQQALDLLACSDHKKRVGPPLRSRRPAKPTRCLHEPQLWDSEDAA